MVAVTVKRWTGFSAPRRLDRGYLTLECAERLLEMLDSADQQAGSELFIACARRMTLDKDEAKNSESPSPSEMTPPASNPTTTSSETDGTSPASASSSETPEST